VTGAEWSTRALEWFVFAVVVVWLFVALVLI
jgi:hypothetical protein